MTASFLIDGQNVTVKFEYTSTIMNATNIVDLMAKELFKRGRGDHGTEEEPIVFGDLSNQDKLNLMDAYWLNIMLAFAKQRNLDDKKELAAEDAADDEIGF